MNNNIDGINAWIRHATTLIHSNRMGYDQAAKEIRDLEKSLNDLRPSISDADYQAASRNIQSLKDRVSQFYPDRQVEAMENGLGYISRLFKWIFQ